MQQIIVHSICKRLLTFISQTNPVLREFPVADSFFLEVFE